MINLLESSIQILEWAVTNRKQVKDDNEFWEIIVNATNSIDKRYSDIERKELMADIIRHISNCYDYEVNRGKDKCIAPIVTGTAK